MGAFVSFFASCSVLLVSLLVRFVSVLRPLESCCAPMVSEAVVVVVAAELSLVVSLRLTRFAYLSGIFVVAICVGKGMTNGPVSTPSTLQ